MCFCEDGPGRKTGLPTWGRMGQVRLGLWKEKKDHGRGSKSKEKSQQEHHIGSSERGKLLGRPEVSAGGSSLKVTRVMTKEA